MTDVSGVGWRDAEPDQFAAAVLTAAELGVLPLAVEKDYWACEALRAITIDPSGRSGIQGRDKSGEAADHPAILRRTSTCS